MTFEELEQVKNQYMQEFGEKGLKLMSFVIEQNMQIDLMKAAIGAAIDKNESVSDQYCKAFGLVHSHLTASMADALSLSDEFASRIFDAASEAYELMRHKAETGESKTND